MADPKGQDPFEAFKAKKKQADRATVESARNDEAAKKLGWIDGIGPAETKANDPKLPKGFVRGRYTKPQVKEEELKKLRPKKFADDKFAKPKAKPTRPEEELPPVEERRPDKFSKY